MNKEQDIDPHSSMEDIVVMSWICKEDMIRVTNCRKTYISKGFSEQKFCFSIKSDFKHVFLQLMVMRSK